MTAENPLRKVQRQVLDIATTRTLPSKIAAELSERGIPQDEVHGAIWTLAEQGAIEEWDPEGKIKAKFPHPHQLELPDL